MAEIPNEVLIVRALSFLEAAKLDLVAFLPPSLNGAHGNVHDAIGNIEKGIELLRRVS